MDLLPYGGLHATYSVSVEYTITNTDNESAAGETQTAKSDDVKVNFVPNFILPNPITAIDCQIIDDENGAIKALASAPVKFDDISLNAYPGFEVSVIDAASAVRSNGGVPMGAEWLNQSIKISPLTGYNAKSDEYSDWSQAAKTEEKLPVAVETSLTGEELTADDAVLPTIEYKLYTHYPVLDLNGIIAEERKGGVASAPQETASSSNVVARRVSGAQPVTDKYESTNSDNYRVSVVSLVEVGNPRVASKALDSDDITLGVSDIVADEAGEAVYYNLQGVRVANPKAGLYIRVQGRNAEKVYIK